MGAPDKASAAAVIPTLDWKCQEIAQILDRALREDVGAGDLTTQAVLPDFVGGRGTLLANGAMVVAGLPLVQRLFERLDPRIRVHAWVQEGAQISRCQVAEVVGDARVLLRGERVALNFLGRLSGIATLTRRFVARVGGTGAQIRDTRKTTPGLRLLERYAVRVGGGANHRMGLYDALLIKENHAQMAGGVGAATRRARQMYGSAQVIQVEVRDQAELREALEAGADAILLDNMKVREVKQAVEIVQGRVLVEVSGGIQLDNIRAYAECGVDFISVGALTHSAPAADVSFDLIPLGNPKL